MTNPKFLTSDNKFFKLHSHCLAFENQIKSVGSYIKFHHLTLWTPHATVGAFIYHNEKKKDVKQLQCRDNRDLVVYNLWADAQHADLA